MEPIYCNVCANRGTVFCEKCGYIRKTDGSISIPTFYCRTNGAMRSDDLVIRCASTIRDYLDRGVPLPIATVMEYNSAVVKED